MNTEEDREHGGMGDTGVYMACRVSRVREFTAPHFTAHLMTLPADTTNIQLWLVQAASGRMVSPANR
jgi:hypothetical protein